jgi:hypothetical protein
MAFGDGNSNASTASTGSYANLLGWRLRFDFVPAPTLEVRSPLGPNNLHFEIGTATSHFRIFATGGDLYALGLTVAGFLPSPIPVPPVAGLLWLTPPIVTLQLGFVAYAPGTVYQQVNLPIPLAPALVGLQVYGQAGTMDLVTNLADLTNAVDFVIQ